MACGQAFASYLEIGGASPKHPCAGKPWCSVEDVNRVAARSAFVFKQIRTFWNQLMGEENRLKNGHAGSRRIRALVTSYEENYASLPTASVFAVAGQTNKVIAYFDNIELGCCCLEKLSAELKALGLAGPETSIANGPGFFERLTQPKNIALILAAVGIGGGLIYLATRERATASRRFGPPSVDDEMERNRAIDSYLRDRKPAEIED